MSTKHMSSCFNIKNLCSGRRCSGMTAAKLSLTYGVTDGKINALLRNGDMTTLPSWSITAAGIQMEMWYRR